MTHEKSERLRSIWVLFMPNRFNAKELRLPLEGILLTYLQYKNNILLSILILTNHVYMGYTLCSVCTAICPLVSFVKSFTMYGPLPWEMKTSAPSPSNLKCSRGCVYRQTNTGLHSNTLYIYYAPYCPNIISKISLPQEITC